jgi:ATP-dependent DNA helicase RecG
MFLRELNQPVGRLKGVGPKYSELLAKLGIETTSDLILHFPRSYIDRSNVDKIADGLKKETVNVIVRVIAHDYIGWGRNRILKVIVEDSSGQAALVCFGRNYLEKLLVPGRSFFVTGSFKLKYGSLQCSNFLAEAFDDEDAAGFERIIPAYPLTAGLSQGMLKKFVKQAFDAVTGEIEDELPVSLVRRHCFVAKKKALRSLHFPATMEEVDEARKSLVYEELFYLQLLIGRRRLSKQVTRKLRVKIGFANQARLLARLPFSLTPDQLTSLDEIYADIFSDHPMYRLLQGDVGCGKTLVALLAALAVIESGEQAAFMAPTELLARQHAENIARLAEPLGINIGFLSGSIRDEERKLLVSALVAGDIKLLVGTHALFSEDISFRKLGLVIVDEQHRFGVLQRLRLLRKGDNPDLLLMTATPIPRSLALTAFGDLDVSTIRSMPVGRKPIVTHLTREGNESKVYDRVRREVEAGRQVYIVYPLIEESEKLDLKDALSMFAKLSAEVFPDLRLGLIHSKVREDEKLKVMEDFFLHKTDILVATSVVEVGVDVPNATAIVIEHAERFGLSALHQLRGRVGRGEHQSYAFLIYSEKLTPDGIERLKVMMETLDGFKIAEEDLKLRGPGELLGARQSGFLRLRIADLVRDKRLLLVARKDAFALLEADPGLLEPGHAVIRNVLAKVPPFQDEFADSG